MISGSIRRVIFLFGGLRPVTTALRHISAVISGESSSMMMSSSLIALTRFQSVFVCPRRSNSLSSSVVYLTILERGIVSPPFLSFGASERNAPDGISSPRKLLRRPRSASENGSRSTTSSVRIRVWTTNRPTRHTVETAVPVLRFPSTRRRRRAPQNRTPYIRCKPDKTLGDRLSRSAARGRRSGNISLGGESTRGVDRLSLLLFLPGEPPMDLLLDAQLWASLLTLTALEIVLGIDNLIFISIVSGRLPANRQRSARRIGLALAVITRLLLLAAIAWLVGLTQPLFPVRGHSVSLRDIILAAGGLFLLAKGTAEIHATME